MPGSASSSATAPPVVVAALGGALLLEPLLRAAPVDPALVLETALLVRGQLPQGGKPGHGQLLDLVGSALRAVHVGGRPADMASDQLLEASVATPASELEDRHRESASIYNSPWPRPEAGRGSSGLSENSPYTQ